MQVKIVLIVWFCVLPLTAVAGEPKEVEVINLPEVQDVFVTNPPADPPAASVSRIQFVGLTTASYTGNLGGVFGATTKPVPHESNSIVL